MRWGRFEKKDISETKETKNEGKENKDLKNEKEKCKDFRDSLKVHVKPLDLKENADKKKNDNPPNKGQREIGNER